MRQALVDDLLMLDQCEPIVLVDPRVADRRSGVYEVQVAPGEAETELHRWATRADFTIVVAPETGGTLARLATNLTTWGSTTLGSRPEAIALTSDKLRFARHLDSRGIETPPTRRLASSEACERAIQEGVVIKPRDGAGSESTWMLKRGDAVPELPTDRDWIMQPWVEGEPMSASFLVGRDGSVVLLGVARQSIALENQAVRYEGGSLPYPRALAWGAPLRAVRSVPGLFGFVGVDFIRTPDGRSVVLELNPRLTTSYVGLRHLYEPGAILESWLRLARHENSSPSLVATRRLARQPRIVFRSDGSIVSRGIDLE
ncbi:MAG: ATP-grasp domain-containing protein [Isosphaeraceae bacterium]